MGAGARGIGYGAPDRASQVADASGTCQSLDFGVQNGTSMEITLFLVNDLIWNGGYVTGRTTVQTSVLTANAHSNPFFCDGFMFFNSMVLFGT